MLPPAPVKEKLLYLPFDFTRHVATAQEVKGNPGQVEDRRSELLATALHSGVALWLLSRGLIHLGLTRRVVIATEAADPHGAWSIFHCPADFMSRGVFMVETKRLRLKDTLRILG